MLVGPTELLVPPQLEISELEEQKVQLEQQVKQLKETVARLQVQVQQGGGRSGEVERRSGPTRLPSSSAADPF